MQLAKIKTATFSTVQRNQQKCLIPGRKEAGVEALGNGHVGEQMKCVSDMIIGLQQHKILRTKVNTRFKNSGNGEVKENHITI